MEHEIAGFLQDQKRVFEEFCRRHDPSGDCHRNDWTCPPGTVDVIMWRGDVFEKASAIFCDLQIDTPPVLAQTIPNSPDRMRALVLEMNLFPANPHVPKGYMELRAHVLGRVILAGGTDLFPYIEDREAIGIFSSYIQQVCREHHQDYEALRKVRADFFRSRYTGENVGSHAGIYFFSLDQEHVRFYRDMASAFFQAYDAIITRRAALPVSAQDRARMLSVHGQWAQWILLEDEGTRFGLDKGIPAEALLGAILPPVATF